MAGGRGGDRPGRYRQLKVDYDVAAFPWATWNTAASFLSEQLGLRFLTVRRHKTERGWHLTATLSRAVPATAIVAIQAIAGSDPRRETFNLLRALGLDDAPGFWRTRWNVLYARKLHPQRERHMVSLKNYGGEKKPSLKAKDLGGANAAILTVTRAQEVDVNRDGEESKALVMEFKELPDFAYWPNNTSVRNLVEALGEDEEDWEGKRVPLEVVRTTNPSTHKGIDALWVAKPEDWRDMIRSYGKFTGKGKGKRGAKKTASKKKAARRK